MVKLPSISARELMKVLKKRGFEERVGRGSHRVFNHPDGLHTVIAVHPGQIPFGTLRQILKQARLSVDDLR